MLDTLRRRYTLSHILPILIVGPLMGIALIYVLETQVLLPNLSTELKAQAAIIAEVAAQQPVDLWTSPQLAQEFIDEYGNQTNARLILLDAQGRLLGSSDKDDLVNLGQPFDPPGGNPISSGRVEALTFYSQHLEAEVVDVVTPISGPGQSIVGAVRLTYRLTTVYDRFLRLRYLIVAVLAAGIVLGGAVGWALALNVERPLRRVTDAIDKLSEGQSLSLLTPQGPREIDRLVQAYNALVDRLHSLEEARNHLLANLVHELGRPLGALRSAIQALQGGADDDASLRQDLLIGIDEELRRLQRLLDDVAGLHDQVLGTLELNRQPVNVNEWLPHVLTAWREAAHKKGLHWGIVLPDNLPRVKLDPDRAAQAVGNLVSNAIKYTSRPGSVKIEAGTAGGRLFIRVNDTGPGMSREEQAHIFDPFYRGRSVRRFPQGMGLGLSIARDMVAAHGGQIEVDSAPGLGTHFTIWLPIDTDTPRS